MNTAHKKIHIVQPSTQSPTIHVPTISFCYGITQIKASAGSGKTHTLTEQFMQSLARIPISTTCTMQKELKNIVAMTFTNKAVAEMKKKIIRRMKEIALQPNMQNTIIKNSMHESGLSSTKAVQWVNTIVAHYASLRVQSIDSTLMQIVRSISLFLGIASSATPLLGREEDITITKVCAEYMERLSQIEYSSISANSTENNLLHTAYKTLVYEGETSLSTHITLQKQIIALVKLFLRKGIFTEAINKETVQILLAEYSLCVEELYKRFFSSTYQDIYLQALEKMKQTLESCAIPSTMLLSYFTKALDKTLFPEKSFSAMFFKNSFEDICRKGNYKKLSEEIQQELEREYQSLKNTIAGMKDIFSILSSVKKAKQIESLVRIALGAIVHLEEYQKKEGVLLFSAIPSKLINFFYDKERMVRGAVVPSSLYSLLEEFGNNAIFLQESNIYEVLCRIGIDVHTIFFDEFQDTSKMQWYTLIPLIQHVLSNEHGGSFIYVGDVKQSIYSWRGGDSSLFEGIIQFFPNIPLRKESLPCNWRSEEAIISFANTFSIIGGESITGVLPQSEYLQETIVAENREKDTTHMLHTSHAYKCLERILGKTTTEKIAQHPHILEEGAKKIQQAYYNAQQQLPKSTKEKGIGYVSITEFILEKNSKKNIEEEEEKTSTTENVEDNTVENKYAHIQEEIYRTLSTIVDEGKNIGDIAILVRTNAEGILVSDWLLEWGFPYTMEGGIEIYKLPLVQHIIAMLRFIHIPSDAHFYAVITSSLFCGSYEESTCIRPEDQKHMHSNTIPPQNAILQQEEIMQWYLNIKKENPYANIQQAFMKEYPKLWRRYFEPFINHTATYTPYQYMQECIRCFSVYQRFSGKIVYIRSLLEFTFASHIGKSISLGDFLQYFEEHQKDFVVSPRGGMQAIQILTIHKSKGLEFPIVIIPFTKTAQKGGAMPLDIFTVGELIPKKYLHGLENYTQYPIITNITSEHILYYRKKVEEAIESINLMYVALTRAEKELYIFIEFTATNSTNDNEEEDIKAPSNSPSLLIRYILENEDILPQYNLQSYTQSLEKNRFTYRERKIEQTIEKNTTLQEYSLHEAKNIQVAEKIKASNGVSLIDNNTEKEFSLFLENITPLSSTHDMCKEMNRSVLFNREHIYGNKSISNNILQKNISKDIQGIIFHTALEYCRYGMSIQRAIEHSFNEHSLVEYSTEYMEEMVPRIQWFMEHSIGAMCMEHGIFEQAMYYVEENTIASTVRQGKIVRADSIVRVNNTCFVLEYKTGMVSKEHEKQLAQYLQVIENIIPHGVVIKGILIYFYAPYTNEDIIENKAIERIFYERE